MNSSGKKYTMHVLKLRISAEYSHSNDLKLNINWNTQTNWAKWTWDHDSTNREHWNWIHRLGEWGFWCSFETIFHWVALKETIIRRKRKTRVTKRKKETRVTRRKKETRCFFSHIKRFDLSDRNDFFFSWRKEYFPKMHAVCILYDT